MIIIVLVGLISVILQSKPRMGNKLPLSLITAEFRLHFMKRNNRHDLFIKSLFFIGSKTFLFFRKINFIIDGKV